jgi:hypothetical protein
VSRVAVTPRAVPFSSCANMRANGLVLVRDHEPGETRRGHVVVPEPNPRIATDFTTCWTRKAETVAIVPTIDCGCRGRLIIPDRGLLC